MATWGLNKGAEDLAVSYHPVTPPTPTILSSRQIIDLLKKETNLGAGEMLRHLQPIAGVSEFTPGFTRLTLGDNLPGRQQVMV